MKDWKQYITEVKNVHSKEDLMTALRASRGLNSDNPSQDSPNTEEEDKTDYEKKELEYVNTELAKKTNKSNKKVKSLKKKIKKLKGKVSDLEDEKEELEQQVDQQGAEDETQETEKPDEAPEGKEGGEGTDTEEAEGEGDQGGEEEGNSEEGGQEEGSEEGKEKGLNYDDDLDAVIELGGKKKKKNESLEKLIDGPLSVLLEAINDGVKFEDNYIWWDKYPCWFASVVSPETKGVVVLKGSHDLHVVGTGFTKNELEDCMKCLTENLPPNVKQISSRGGISPGGINVLLRLKDYGWTLSGTESGDDHYWCAEIDPDKFVGWISKVENEDYWEETGEATGDFLKDTRPKVPVMKRSIKESKDINKEKLNESVPEADLEKLKTLFNVWYREDYDTFLTQDEKNAMENVFEQLRKTDPRWEKNMHLVFSDAARYTKKVREKVSDVLKELGEDYETFSKEEKNIVDDIVKYALRSTNYGMWPYHYDFVKKLREELWKALKGSLKDFYYARSSGAIFKARHAKELEELKKEAEKRQAEYKIKKKKEEEERERLRKEDPKAYWNKYVRNTVNDPSWTGPNGTWSLD